MEDAEKEGVGGEGDPLVHMEAEEEGGGEGDPLVHMEDMPPLVALLPVASEAVSNSVPMLPVLVGYETMCAILGQPPILHGTLRRSAAEELSASTVKLIEAGARPPHTRPVLLLPLPLIPLPPFPYSPCASTSTHAPLPPRIPSVAPPRLSHLACSALAALVVRRSASNRQAAGHKDNPYVGAGGHRLGGGGRPGP